MNRTVTRFIIRPAIFVLLLILVGCGESEWEALSKIGNSWQYNMEKNGSKFTVSTKVVANYKIGETVYALLQTDKRLGQAGRIFSWEADNKALLEAGRRSPYGENSLEFFTRDRVIGSLKAAKGKSYSGWVYQGKEKVKTPLGDQEVFVFVKGKQKTGFNAKYGVVSYQAPGIKLILKKFTAGKGGDPKSVGSSAGFAVLKNFVKLMAGSGIDGAANYCTPSGKKSLKNASAQVKLVLEKLHKDIKNNGPVTMYHKSGQNYGLRFNYFLEDDGKPAAYRADLTVTLKGEKKKLIDSLRLSVKRIAPK